MGPQSAPEEGASATAADGGALLAQHDFRRLWLGQSISALGSQITVLALPLTAVLVLHASTLAVALLTTASYAAFLVIGLPSGAWVDRHRRRPIMIGADVARALTLASVPIAYALGDLGIAQLYVVAAIEGVATVLFDVAYMSYLPALVGRRHLVDANAKLQVSESVAQVAGPGASGGLVGLLSAPGAVLTDAASFVMSFVSLLMIAGPEPAPVRNATPNLRREIAEGLRLVVRHPILRMIAGATASTNLFMSAFVSISVVFLVRQVGLRAGEIGLLNSLAALGGVAGAFAATWLRRRIGSARIIWLSACVANPCTLLIPLTRHGVGVVWYAAALFIVDAGFVVYNVNQASFRQLLCPPELLGRMNATMRFLVWGTMPFGGILGGVLGGQLGVRGAIWVAAAGVTLSALWVLASPLRRMRDTPEV